MKRAKDVDEYIARAPKEVRRKLNELRATIKSAAPKAEERISYGMPYYGYKGRVAYFRHWRRHIGLYLPSPVIEEHRRELKDYETARATVRFPLEARLPIALIKRLIRARVRMNEAKE
jgi:uncharacterized protein YdhG (YjbR/CyaY superfamily)